MIKNDRRLYYRRNRNHHMGAVERFSPTFDIMGPSVFCPLQLLPLADTSSLGTARVLSQTLLNLRRREKEE